MSLEFKFLLGPEVVEAEKQLPVLQQVTWPIDSIVCYAYDGDKIIGRMGLMSIKVIEGTWVQPDAPPTTAFRMMKQMLAILPVLGNSHALAMVYDEAPKVADYLERVGFERFPVTLYQQELVKKEEEAA